MNRISYILGNYEGVSSKNLHAAIYEPGDLPLSSWKNKLLEILIKRERERKITK